MLIVVPNSDVAIDDLLAELGFRLPAARDAARAALETAGLTRAGKTRIATDKRARVAELLGEHFVVVCTRATCRATARGLPQAVVDAAEASACQICGGSANRSELDRAVAALHAVGWRKLVVVGGSPALHEELRALAGDRLSLRLVDGTARRKAPEAHGDIAWADLVLVWGGTELDHKVSKLYTDTRSPKVVGFARRGIAALATTIVEATRARGR